MILYIPGFKGRKAGHGKPYTTKLISAFYLELALCWGGCLLLKEAGEMAQLLGVFAALAENLGLIPISRGFGVLFWHLPAWYTHHACVHAHTHICTI